MTGRMPSVGGFECTQLHHVNIVVDDLDAARTFYRDVLLLREIERPAFPTAGFWLEVGTSQVHVALGDEPAPTRHHFALEVTDFEAAVAHAESNGLRVTRFPVVEGVTASHAALRDPAGNLIELRQS
jgi:glyoxylase I family protein